MSTTCLVRPIRWPPWARCPGVADAVDSVRKAVDRVYGHRVMRRRSNEITSEAALRGARGSAALSGADWALEEVRRRSDFGADDEARTVGAALRLTAEAGQLLVHLAAVAAAGAGPAAPGGGRRRRPGDDTVGRPRLAGEPVDEPLVEAARCRTPSEVAGRLDGLAELIIAGGCGARPGDGRRRARRTAGAAPLRLLQRPGRAGGRAHRAGRQRPRPEVRSARPRSATRSWAGRRTSAAFEGYVSGTPEGMAAWIAHCGRARRTRGA